MTQARAGIVNAETPEDMSMFGKQINTAINLAFEAYPQIRSTENFGALQAQLEGTENRINKARTDYNGTVKRYNNGNILINPDKGRFKGLWRLVQNGNSEKMIMVL